MPGIQPLRGSVSGAAAAVDAAAASGARRWPARCARTARSAKVMERSPLKLCAVTVVTQHLCAAPSVGSGVDTKAGLCVTGIAHRHSVVLLDRAAATEHPQSQLSTRRTNACSIPHRRHRRRCSRSADHDRLLGRQRLGRVGRRPDRAHLLGLGAQPRQGGRHLERRAPRDPGHRQQAGRRRPRDHQAAHGHQGRQRRARPDPGRVPEDPDARRLRRARRPRRHERSGCLGRVPRRRVGLGDARR